MDVFTLLVQVGFLLQISLEDEHTTSFVICIYTTKGEMSSICEEFLSQFHRDHGFDFSAPTCCQSATFVRLLFAFNCPLFFTKKN